MTIAFRAYAPATGANQPANCVIPIPAGTQVGDLLLATVSADGGAGSIAAATGWTQLRNVTNTTPDGQIIALFYRVADGTEGTSQSFPTTGVGGHVSGWMLAYSGVHPVTPFDTTLTSNNSNVGNTSPVAVTCPAITTVSNNVMLVTIAQLDQNQQNATNTLTTVQAGMTDRFGRGSQPAPTKDWCYGIAADMLLPVPTAQTAVVHTVTLYTGGETSGYDAVTLALRPIDAWAAPLAASSSVTASLTTGIQLNAALTSASSLSATQFSYPPNILHALDSWEVNEVAINDDPAPLVDADDGWGDGAPSWFPLPARGLPAFAAVLLATACGFSEDVPTLTTPTATDSDEVWTNPVRPVPPSNCLRLPLGDQDSETPPLYGQPDEDFPGTLPAPVQATLGRLYLPDPEEIPAGSLFGTAEEDFWVSGLPRPVVGNDFLLLPFAPDVEELPAADFFGCPDADEQWVNHVAPVPGSLGRLYLPDPEEIPAGSLYGTPDADDIWEERPPPFPTVAADYIVPAWQPDVEEIPAADLFGQPDEDFPGPLPAPVPPRHYLRLAWLPDTDQDVPPLYGQPDEDFWVSGVPPVVASNRVSLPWEPELDELPTTLEGAPDLDEVWRNPVAPVVASNRVPPPILDQEEIPAGFLFGQPDEDFPGPLPAPVQATNRVSLPLGDPDSEVPALYGVPEEDQLIPPRPWPLTTALPFLADDEIPSTVATPVDEDFWVSGVAPVPPAFRAPLPYEPDVEEIPAGSLFGEDDEDFWKWPQPAPVVAADYIVPAWQPDVEELPAADFYGVPEEDQYRAPVLPLPPIVRPFTDTDDPAGSLYGQDDEDFSTWPKPAPVVAADFLLLPFAPDLEELPAADFYGQPDEDFWRPPAPWALTTAQPVLDAGEWVPFVATTVVEDEPYLPPVARPAGNFFALPYEPDGDGEIPAGFLRGQPDEDFWVSGVPPVPPQNHLVLPYLPDEDQDVPPLSGTPDADETWRNPVAPVPGSLGRLYLPDPEELPAGFLRGIPDEDEQWENWVAPVPASLGRLYLPDPEELPAGFLRGIPDEDEQWENWVPPVPPSNFVLFPYGPDEDIQPTLFGAPDLDEVWRNPVRPVPPSHFIRLPFAPDSDDIYPSPAAFQVNAVAGCTVTASLSTSILLATTASASSTATAALSTGINLAVNATAGATVTASLSTQILLATTASALARATVSFDFTQLAVSAFCGFTVIARLGPPDGMYGRYGFAQGKHDDPWNRVPPGGWPTGDTDEGPLQDGMFDDGPLSGPGI